MSRLGALHLQVRSPFKKGGKNLLYRVTLFMEQTMACPASLSYPG